MAKTPTYKRKRRPNGTKIGVYQLEVTGDDKAARDRIARQLKKGISAAADVCKISPPVCVGNLGIPREQMPQIEGESSLSEMVVADDQLQRAKGKAILEAGGSKSKQTTVLDQMLNRLEAGGVKTTRGRVPVGELKATQSEIKAAKVYGMASAHLSGDFPHIAKRIIISKDNHILDGHHRWAALITIDPKMMMDVLRVGLPIKDLLWEAAATPGVYRADFAGWPLGARQQRLYKEKHRTRLKRKRPASKAKPKARKPLSKAEQKRRLAAALRS